MSKRFNSLIIPTILFFTSNIFSVIIDNRFIPLYSQMFDRYPNKKSAAGTNVFFLTGNKARSEFDDDIEIPELNGKYDLIKIGEALKKIGKKNPIKTEWQSFSSIPWKLESAIEGQGWWIGYEQSLSDHISIGTSWYLLHVVNRLNYILIDKTKTDLGLIKGNETILRKELREANESLGILNDQYEKTGVSDLDFYLRLGVVKDYVYKFKRVDTGVRLGMLVPTAPTIEIDNPASIPLGGNGFWGMYVLFDLTLELKEDITTGIWIEFCNRFAKNQKRRVPVNFEPLNFGAVIGDVKIDPGLSFGFSPYVLVDNLADSLGFKIRYTFVWHNEDSWCLDRKNCPKLDLVDDPQVRIIQERSEWIAEYFTFTLMYNFEQSEKCRKFAPVIYAEWDMPTKFIGAVRVAQTNRISLGFNFNF